jgi:hypothetical protein
MRVSLNCAACHHSGLSGQNVSGTLSPNVVFIKQASVSHSRMAPAPCDMTGKFKVVFCPSSASSLPVFWGFSRGFDLMPEYFGGPDGKTPSGGAGHWGLVKVRDVRGRGTSTALTSCRTVREVSTPCLSKDPSGFNKGRIGRIQFPVWLCGVGKVAPDEKILVPELAHQCRPHLGKPGGN